MGEIVLKVSKSKRKILQGQVVSDKCQKTITVLITARKLHPVYQKYVLFNKKIKAHDESNTAHVGDIVRVIESRPMSKDKKWRLLEIVERAR